MKDYVCFAIGAIGSMIASLFGGWDASLQTLVIFMAIDYITGYSAAAKNGEWSSQIAREGLWHKAGCIFAVLVAGILVTLVVVAAV